jgi:glycerol-3-phosphate acyltransferase PlsY
MPAVLSLIAAYLIGSISSAWIIVKIFGNRDMRKEPDGTISAASVYHKIGILPYLLTVFMDIVLGALAVILAHVITNSPVIAMLAGLAAMAGHNWSIFLRLKGGQGATTMAGAIGAVMLIPLGYGLLAAALTVLMTHRSWLSTIIGVFTMAFVALVDNAAGTPAIYPLSLLLLMTIKRLQLSRTNRHNALNSTERTDNTTLPKSYARKLYFSYNQRRLHPPQSKINSNGDAGL